VRTNPNHRQARKDRAPANPARLHHPAMAKDSVRTNPTTDTRKGRARRTRPRPLLLNRGLSFEQFRDQGRDGRAFGAGQGDVAEERVSFQGFDDGGDPVMAADAEVVALGDVVGEDNL
jgi:hypothetical protein